MQRRPRLVRLVPLVFACAAALAPTAVATPADIGPGLSTTPLLTAIEAREHSKAALQALLSTSPNAHALWRPGQAGPSVVTGLREPAEGDTGLARASSFVHQREALLGVSAGALRSTGARSFAGRVVVTFQQMLADKDVHGRTLAVTLDEDGHVLSLSNDLMPVGARVGSAIISMEAAKAKALATVGASGGSGGRAVVVVTAAGAFEAASFLVARPGTLAAVEVLVNLHDGTVSSIQNAVRE